MKDAPVATTRYPMAANSRKDIEQEVWVVQSDSSGGEDESELRECSGSSGEELDLHVALAGQEVADGSGEWWTELLVKLSPQNLGPSRLHCDVLRFCQTLELTPLEQEVRGAAVRDLRSVISQLWPRSTVCVHGSTATALCLPSSDIDLALDPGAGLLPTFQWQQQLRNQLQRSRLALSVHAIPKAKVPILKLVLRGSGLRVDISCHVFNGPKAVPWVRHQLGKHPPLRPLCLLLKCYLGQRGWNEPFSGGMGSYCLLLLLVAHLEAIQQQAGGQMQWADMGRILVSFLTFFGRVFDYKRDVVSLGGRPHLVKKERGWVGGGMALCLAVEDPQSGKNIGSATYRIAEIRSGFAAASGDFIRVWDRVGLPLLLDVNRARGQLAAFLPTEGEKRNQIPTKVRLPDRAFTKGGPQKGRESKRKEGKGRQPGRQKRGGGVGQQETLMSPYQGRTALPQGKLFVNNLIHFGEM